jgi:hypothetical protein
MLRSGSWATQTLPTLSTSPGHGPAARQVITHSNRCDIRLFHLVGDRCLRFAVVFIFMCVTGYAWLFKQLGAVFGDLAMQASFC